MKLDSYGAEMLEKRKDVGLVCIATAASHAIDETHEDFETFATDAVSDILTALLGPAGHYNGHDVHVDPDVNGRAHAFLDAALRSWEGDAEDYEPA